jgi:predicted TIM-barrel fold metal-dependent hydrolase
MDLSGLAVLDQHAHGLMKPELLPAAPYRQFLTEASDPDQIAGHVPHTLSYRRNLREIAALLGVEPVEVAIVARRTAMGAEAYARLFIQAARIEAAYLDDGFAPEQLQPVGWHEQFFAVRRILRLETHAERILTRARTLDDFVGALRDSLDAPLAGVVAFKSIAAYRTGLDVRPPDRGEVHAAFLAYRRGAGRLAHKALVDHILYLALEIAARREMPVQFHTGFGDPDLDLRLATPLHLRAVLEEPRFRGVPIVMLHASYPFVREAGYLAATYSNVYLDFGLAIPLLSVHGMECALAQLLELAPASKVMYSSDAHHIPELYYLSACRAREALGNVLDQAVRDRDLTADEAEVVAEGVLRSNARRVYRGDRR